MGGRGGDKERYDQKSLGGRNFMGTKDDSARGNGVEGCMLRDFKEKEEKGKIIGGL